VKIGFVGLGKLGLPVALTIASKGHKVYGFDTDIDKMRRYANGESGLWEPGIDQNLVRCLDDNSLRLQGQINKAVADSNIIFVAVPTPHELGYGGEIPDRLPPRDFDYSYLRQACKAIAEINPAGVVAIISTVLPGTSRREILPILGDHFIYNPAFIAMGQTEEDYLDPEFVLCGGPDGPAGVLREFYSGMMEAQFLHGTFEEAELVKIMYNTFIGWKIVFANTVMEICHKIGNANCDRVSYALGQATDRIISSKYMFGGMGDGGACHPRDNIAMSYLCEQLGIAYDPFSFIMRIRTEQARYLADLVLEELVKDADLDLKVVIMGKTYKPDTDLLDGSPSLLLGHILKERGVEVQWYDPAVCKSTIDRTPRVFVLATPWTDLVYYDYPTGSVVIDPWGLVMADNQNFVKVVRVGRSR